jgi:hypothetical protein
MKIAVRSPIDEQHAEGGYVLTVSEVACSAPGVKQFQYRFCFLTTGFQSREQRSGISFADAGRINQSNSRVCAQVRDALFFVSRGVADVESVWPILQGQRLPVRE